MISLVMGLLWGAAAHAQERYLCVADQATGFFYDAGSNTWKTTQFNAAEMKYIIRPSNSEKRPFEIKAMALDMVSCWSEGGFDNQHQISFRCLTGQFIFNKKTGRFIRSDMLGYIGGDNFDTRSSRRQNPHIAIGRCSPF